MGTEILFVLGLALVVLDPKRLQTILAQVARAKAQFEHARRDLKSELAAELDDGRCGDKTDVSRQATTE